MDWSECIDKLLYSKKVSKAAIIGSNEEVGGSGKILASSKDFQITDQEGKVIVNDYDGNYRINFSLHGITCGFLRYPSIEADDRCVWGIKFINGVVCVKTNQTVIIGIFDKDTELREAQQEVIALGNILANDGY